MDDNATWTIHTDGAARGNPGPAAFAYVIARPGLPVIEASGHLGDTTNNIAEYTALVRGLERARELSGRRLVIHSDSELMVRQMNGAYKVKHPGILELHRRAQELVRQFESVQIRHVRREANSEADRLCNEALDNPMPELPRSASPVRVAAAKPRAAAKGSSALLDGPRAKAFRDCAVPLLEAAAAQWADADPKAPTPEAVCNEILAILRQEGLLD
jgi:ribonuclease HI